MKKKNIYFNHTQYISLWHLFSPVDRIFYPQNNLNIFLIIVIIIIAIIIIRLRALLLVAPVYSVRADDNLLSKVSQILA